MKARILILSMSYWRAFLLATIATIIATIARTVATIIATTKTLMIL